MTAPRILLTVLLTALAVGGVVVILQMLLSSEEPGPGAVIPGQKQVAEAPREGGVERPVRPIRPIPLQTGERGARRTQAQKAVENPLGGPRQMTVHGRVTKEAGGPIAGARVTLWENVSRNLQIASAGLVRGAVETNKEGYYSLTALMGVGSQFLLHITHDEHARRWVRAIDPLQPATFQQNVSLEEGQAVIGTVKTSGGGPLSGASVTIQDLESPARDEQADPERAVVTGADGTFRLEAISGGSKALLVSASGFCPAMRPSMRLRRGGRVAPLTVMLAPGATISGRVLDGGTRSGIPNARISIRPVGRGNRDEVHLRDGGTAAGDGSFSVRDVPGGIYILQATAVGYAASTVVNACAPAENVLLTLEAQASISGRVVDPSGRGVPHCSIVAGRTPDPKGAQWRHQTRIDREDGSFTLPTVPTGEIYVFALAPGVGGGRAGPFALEKGQMLAGIEVQIQRGAVVTGHVIDERGQPLEGASVALLRKIVLPKPRHAGQQQSRNLLRRMLAPMQEVLTHGDGSFLLAAMEPGRYRLRVSGGGAYVPKETELLTLDTGTERSVPDIQLELGASIEGTVLDTRGLPDPRATVNVMPAAGGTGSWAASTDKAGSFSIKGLPAGRFKVLVTVRGGAADMGALERNSRGQAMTVELTSGCVERLELKAGR